MALEFIIMLRVGAGEGHDNASPSGVDLAPLGRLLASQGKAGR